jgi:hypothetical protein
MSGQVLIIINGTQRSLVEICLNLIIVTTNIGGEKKGKNGQASIVIAIYRVLAEYEAN